MHCPPAMQQVTESPPLTATDNQPSSAVETATNPVADLEQIYTGVGTSVLTSNRAATQLSQTDISVEVNTTGSPGITTTKKTLVRDLAASDVVNYLESFGDGVEALRTADLLLQSPPQVAMPSEIPQLQADIMQQLNDMDSNARAIVKEWRLSTINDLNAEQMSEWNKHTNQRWTQCRLDQEGDASEALHTALTTTQHAPAAGERAKPLLTKADARDLKSAGADADTLSRLMRVVVGRKEAVSVPPARTGVSVNMQQRLGPPPAFSLHGTNATNSDAESNNSNSHTDHLLEAVLTSVSKQGDALSTITNTVNKQEDSLQQFAVTINDRFVQQGQRIEATLAKLTSMPSSSPPVSPDPPPGGGPNDGPNSGNGGGPSGGGNGPNSGNGGAPTGGSGRPPPSRPPADGIHPTPPVPPNRPGPAAPGGFDAPSRSNQTLQVNAVFDETNDVHPLTDYVEALVARLMTMARNGEHVKSRAETNIYDPRNSQETKEFNKESGSNQLDAFTDQAENSTLMLEFDKIISCLVCILYSFARCGLAEQGEPRCKKMMSVSFDKHMNKEEFHKLTTFYSQFLKAYSTGNDYALATAMEELKVEFINDTYVVNEADFSRFVAQLHSKTHTLSMLITTLANRVRGLPGHDEDTTLSHQMRTQRVMATLRQLLSDDRNGYGGPSYRTAVNLILDPSRTDELPLVGRNSLHTKVKMIESSQAADRTTTPQPDETNAPTRRSLRIPGRQPTVDVRGLLSSAASNGNDTTAIIEQQVRQQMQLAGCFAQPADEPFAAASDPTQASVIANIASILAAAPITTKNPKVKQQLATQVNALRAGARNSGRGSVEWVNTHGVPGKPAPFAGREDEARYLLHLGRVAKALNIAIDPNFPRDPTILVGELCFGCKLVRPEINQWFYHESSPLFSTSGGGQSRPKAPGGGFAAGTAFMHLPGKCPCVWLKLHEAVKADPSLMHLFEPLGGCTDQLMI